ncbi:MAG: phosphatidate cytidylyltransferase [Erysipelotrichaceae bacterium]
MKEMLQRILVAIIIAIISIPFLVIGGLFFDIFIIIALLPVAFEVVTIKKFKHKRGPAFLVYFMMLTLCFCDPKNISYYIGLGYVVAFIFPLLDFDYKANDLLAIMSLIIIISLGVNGIRNLRIFSLSLTILVIVATYASDSCAYFGGYYFGKHKLVPAISPKKTVEGAIGGWIGGFVFLLISRFIFFADLNSIFSIILAISLPLVAQIGDLAFSAIKRNYDLKDFGKIFPGHGGILDRIDSLIFTFMFVNFLINIVGMVLL